MGRGDGTAAGLNERLRALPSVEQLAAALDGPRALAVAAARTAIDEERERLLAGSGAGVCEETGHIRRFVRTAHPEHLSVRSFDALRDRARAVLADAERPSLRRVLNATGVIVHTNLGRAPLAEAARAAVAARRRGLREPRARPRERARAARARRTSRRCCAS